jgi:hypothetical protein
MEEEKLREVIDTLNQKLEDIEKGTTTSGINTSPSPDNVTIDTTSSTSALSIDSKLIAETLVTGNNV